MLIDTHNLGALFIIKMRLHLEQGPWATFQVLRIEKSPNEYGEPCNLLKISKQKFL